MKLFKMPKSANGKRRTILWDIRTYLRTFDEQDGVFSLLI
jgi:hypothetical protein